MGDYKFSDQLAELVAGTVDAELTARLSDLVKSVRITGLSGHVTLKLEVKRHKTNEDLAVLISKVTSKIPTRPLDMQLVATYSDGTCEAVEEDVTPLRAVGGL